MASSPSRSPHLFASTKPPPTVVNQYAAFIHATADDVVNKALDYVFSKGRDFEDFLKGSDPRAYAGPRSQGSRRTGP